LLSNVFVNFQRFEHICKDFIVQSTRPFLRVFIIPCDDIILCFSRVPSSILEADASARSSADAKQEVMYQIGWYVLVIIIVRLPALVELDELFNLRLIRKYE